MLSDVAVTIFDLLRAFHEVVQRFEAQRMLEVEHEEVTVEQKIEDIRRLFLVHDSCLLRLLQEAHSSAT
jgi:hypothetical protein